MSDGADETGRMSALKHLVYVRERNCEALNSPRIALLDDLIRVIGEGLPDQSWYDADAWERTAPLRSDDEF